MRLQGTNGGVTLLGCAASAAGGLFMGLVFYCGSIISPGIRGNDAMYAAAAQQWVLILLGECITVDQQYVAILSLLDA